MFQYLLSDKPESKQKFGMHSSDLSYNNPYCKYRVFQSYCPFLLKSLIAGVSNVHGVMWNVHVGRKNMNGVSNGYGKTVEEEILGRWWKIVEIQRCN